MALKNFQIVSSKNSEKQLTQIVFDSNRQIWLEILVCKKYIFSIAKIKIFVLIKTFFGTFN